MMEDSIRIVTDLKDQRIVVIDNIRFKGKRKINWEDVENYIKKYIGKSYEMVNEKDRIYIGKDLPDEYSGSKDTAKLKGTLAKAKANAVQGMPELLENAVNGRYRENLAVKHETDAKFGWYRYDSRFALPVYSDNGKAERFNIFKIELLIRCDADGKKYLYDMVNIKKETSTPLE